MCKKKLGDCYRSESYIAICIAKDTESSNELVIVREINGNNKLYAMPLEMYNNKFITSARETKVESTNIYYRHFKNKWYSIVAIAEHLITKEKMIVYKAEYGNSQVWIRPLSMFTEVVPDGKENPTGQKFRFMHYSELGISITEIQQEILSTK